MVYNKRIMISKMQWWDWARPIRTLVLLALFIGTLGSGNKLRHSRQLGSSSYLNAEESTRDYNHKPIFKDCATYRPVLKEEEPAGTVVIKVHAEDEDPINNGGMITYSFLTTPGEKLKFEINNVTGVIKTITILDRDEPVREKEAYLAVLATDNGRLHLYDICAFKITIQDVNDNSPVFDKTSYTGLVPLDLPVHHEVMRVSATDIDDGNNSVIRYNLNPKRPDDSGYFIIDEKTGVILLNKTIDRELGHTFRMIARAQDMGEEPKITEIDLDIRVVESHKKAPTFLPRSPAPIKIKENFNEFGATIVRLEAISNINDHPDLLFTLIPGQTEQRNKYGTFRLESINSITDIKLAQHLDYEKNTEYTLTVQVKNNDNLVAETTVHIIVLDVNDNIPLFRELKKGSVFENEPPGTPVMQVRAIDADGTEENNQVTYELGNYQDKFEIDAITGNITTREMFDREAEDSYNVKVIATDNSPSALFKTGEHNKGEQYFRIEIADKNDNPPKFTKNQYVANSISENANINALVIDVKAEDLDTASPVYYSIIAGNTDESFSIESTTGRIIINKPLDYEKITEYNLTVRAFDGVYDDKATVKIFIDDVNDNPPVFENFDRNPTIEEEKLIDGCITIVKAYDPDIPNRNDDQKITYFINKEDQQPFIGIDKTGCLKLKKPLDRDPPNGYPMWTVIVTARDGDISPKANSDSVMVNITLIDINDNAPILDMPQSVVWYENEPPGNITKLRARDFDSEENGPPFHFSIDVNTVDSEITDKFTITGNNLQARVVFDREVKKSYTIPVTITDSGTPRQTGISMLTVIIGDHNDNPMTEGSSSIFVYNYKSAAPPTDIGYVYVNDPDDWDLPDKHFSWSGEPNKNFQLNPNTGMIKMRSSNTHHPINGNYFLKFQVTEETLMIPRHTVNAYVNVTIKDIPEEAVMKSGSIRFYGIDSEAFITPNDLGISKRDKLQERLASMFNTSVDNVDVFTVLHSPHNNYNQSLLDVRFSAHGSPYYAPGKLNAIAEKYSKEIERELKVDIMLVNIDECLFEKLHCNNTCRNTLNISTIPYAVYTNTSSFVGVRAIVDPQCKCELPQSIVCLNGGTIIGQHCECPSGFDGPHCELLDISFQGDGYAIVPPPSQGCKKSILGLNLKSHVENGLVFYLGPMNYNSNLRIQDFMSLEIENGYAVLYVDYGSGTIRLDQTPTKLTDGEEHRIEITRSNNEIYMHVDCKVSECMRLTAPIGPNEFLNVNSPMQIGGSLTNFNELSKYYGWNYTPTNNNFVGCIRNLTIDDYTYDFGELSMEKHVYRGCNHGMSKAVSFGIDTNFLVAILVCVAILLILLLAVVVHRRKRDDLYKDIDDIRENIINYEDEGGGEVDTGYDLNVLRQIYDAPGIDSKIPPTISSRQNKMAPDEVPDICGFLDSKKESCDKDPDTNPFDDVRHYAYEGEGNSDGSLSSLASCTDDGDLKFNYLSNFGPRFRKLADMYGEEPSDEDSDGVEERESESWC
ncbi:hypothetical protein PV327_009868 [Microctonus hyperodae]|uniref:DE-cadherin n=1 Tax=Microctonus hyperodae TaxID=165561 RepID=A0AA39KG04_MICHY|nr:hypothetical protein PV327_009868 [Microctonus hyperodae]